MTRAKRARQALRGQWKGAFLSHWILTTAGIVLFLLEALILRLTGIGLESTVHFDELMTDVRILPHAAIIMGIVILDVLLTSPFRLGQAAYYYEITRSNRQEHISSRLLKSFYSHGKYMLSVKWRLYIWWKRILWGVICYAPAALIFGYGQLISERALEGTASDISLLFAGFFGLFALLAGFVAQQLLMLNYMPAQYLVGQTGSVRKAFKLSKEYMHGRIGETAWMYAGFAGWLLSCLLVVPYFYAAPLFLTTRACFVHEAEHDFQREEEWEKWTIAQTRPIEIGTLPARKPS